MSWITILWSMIASSCLTLAAVQFVVWLKQPEKTSHLMFTLFSLSIAGITVNEYVMMHSPDPESYGRALWWMQIPVSLGVISCVGFVGHYFGTGRRWLGGLVVAVRLLVLLMNFFSSPNLHFQEITSVEQIKLFGGETVSFPHGTPNQLVKIEQLGLFLLVAYIIDAAVRLWKKGGHDNRHRAGLIGGSLAFFVFAGTVNSILTFDDIIRIPVIVSIPFMVVVAAIGYELSSDVVRVGTLRNQLKVSEEDLRFSQQRMALAADSAGLGIWTWDIAGDSVWATERCRELHGAGLEEVLRSDNFFRRIHPDDLSSLRAAINQAISQNRELRAEYRVLASNTPASDPTPPSPRWTRWLEARGRIEVQQDGNRLMHGVSIDITERKRITERIRMVFEAAPSAMVMADDQGRITLVNSQLESVFGYRREELIGQPIEVLLPESLRDQHPRLRLGYFANPAARGMGIGSELVGRRKDGSLVPIEVGLNPINEAGTTSVLASIVDITARKKSEQEVARQRNELAHLSRVTMLGELSGSLAHELNQPLTSILSNAQAAQRFLDHSPPDLGEIREILADIVAEDRRAGEVIRRLRLLLTKGEVQHIMLDINEVVHDVFKLIRSDLISQGVQVKLELASALPHVQADRVQIQQVVLNLAVNACDAMSGIPESQRLLLVRTELLADGEVAMSVSDQGAGIPPERMDQIFEPFFTTKTAGMGLGLAVCRTIVHAHGGRLWAVNNPKRGATFNFVLGATKEIKA